MFSPADAVDTGDLKVNEDENEELTPQLDRVIEQFSEEFRSGHISDRFSSRFCVSMIKIDSTERLTNSLQMDEVLLLLVDGKFYFLVVKQYQQQFRVEVLNCLYEEDLAVFTIGFWTKYALLEFRNGLSFVLLTKMKEVTAKLLQAIVNTSQDIEIGNRDDDMLECLQKEVFSEDENLRFYELIDSGGNVPDHPVHPCVLIITDKTMYLCTQDHVNWALGVKPVFKVIAREKEKQYRDIEIDQMRYTGVFALVFGTSRAFGANGEERRWYLR